MVLTIQTKKGKWCALMAAAKNKHSEVVDALLRRGAEVDFTRDVSNTYELEPCMQVYTVDSQSSLMNLG